MPMHLLERSRAARERWKAKQADRVPTADRLANGVEQLCCVVERPFVDSRHGPGRRRRPHDPRPPAHPARRRPADPAAARRGAGARPGRGVPGRRRHVARPRPGRRGHRRRRLAGRGRRAVAGRRGGGRARHPARTAGARRPAATSVAWADLVAAVLDGFELVITRVPRRLERRRRCAGCRPGCRPARPCCIAVGEPGPLSRRRRDGGVDARVGGRRARVGPPARPPGHRRGSGRRVPRPRRAELWLPGPGRRRVATVERAAVDARRPASPSPVLRPVG